MLGREDSEVRVVRDTDSLSGNRTAGAVINNDGGCKGGSCIVEDSVL